ncbi:thiolase family protein [Paracoccus caeni]|uniref:Thiolase family protein n=1 Tax=Paracoccus caeni TaxID=657651 RepID=A0A934SIA9_9RHOB|nr:thiolase family protein [Paracoccus caeni]MBK4217990.1 thiolase family protein [Paracoccus caeni]
MTGGGAVIVGTLRSAVVPRHGAFDRLEIHQLAAPVISTLLAQTGIAAWEVDELILGNALGAGGNPARLAALQAGLPKLVGGLTIDRQCCSGMDAVLLADALIRAGRCEVVIAGGAESYSRRPMRLRTDPEGGPAIPYDQPPFAPSPEQDPLMPDAADRIAREMNISRQDQDDWAVTSHARAQAAVTRLHDEITVINGVAADPFTRPLTQRLAARAPVLSGTVTKANTAVAADAAAFCLLVSERIAKRLSTPHWRILSGMTLGDDPSLPGIAPVAAIRETLAATGLTPDRLHAIEMMEAFAAQAIACARMTDLPADRINPGGGALARGHPIGASGAINLVRLARELESPGQTGLAAIAAAGGLGTAVVMERIG